MRSGHRRPDRKASTSSLDASATFRIASPQRRWRTFAASSPGERREDPDRTGQILLYRVLLVPHAPTSGGPGTGGAVVTSSTASEEIVSAVLREPLARAPEGKGGLVLFTTRHWAPIRTRTSVVQVADGLFRSGTLKRVEMTGPPAPKWPSTARATSTS
jgi:hypothetical protein